jgi:hypothetical protein
MSVAFTAADAGQVVGDYDDPAGYGSVVYDAPTGTLSPIAVPGATRTYARGINNRGQIAGTYYDGAGSHAFIATPTTVPEPSAGALVAAGAGVLGALARRRGRGPARVA